MTARQNKAPGALIRKRIERKKRGIDDGSVIAKAVGTYSKILFCCVLLEKQVLVVNYDDAGAQTEQWQTDCAVGASRANEMKASQAKSSRQIDKITFYDTK